MFEEELERIGLAMPFEKAVAAIALASCACAGLEFAFVFQETGLPQALAAIGTAVLPPVLFYFFLEYLQDEKRREIGRELPAALFQMASFPRGSPLEKMIASASGPGGALPREFEKIRRRILAGESVPSALAHASRGQPPAFSRALSLLAQGYQSGADLSQPLQTLVEDALELRSIAAESASALALQKYTLLAGSAIILPGVLAILLSLVSTLSAGQQTAESAPLAPAFEFSMQAYLVVFAALSSAFIAHSEAAGRKAVLYFCVLAPVSLLAFNAVRLAGFS